MAITQVKTIDLLKLTFLKFSSSPLPENTLDVNDLNTNGDVINYYSKQQEPEYVLLGKIPRPLFKEPPLSTDAQKALIDFIDYCNTHNITIYATWPNFLWYDKKFSGNELDGIHAIEKFYIEHNVEILGDYTDCLYDAKFFYDSPNHLNAEGKRIHTEYLINLLQNKLFR